MFRPSHLNAARTVFGKKASVKLALLKIGVEAVLRIGGMLQRRGRTGQPFGPPRYPAA